MAIKLGIIRCGKLVYNKPERVSRHGVMPTARELVQNGIETTHAFPGKQMPVIIYPTAENFEQFRNFIVDRLGRNFEILARFSWEVESYQTHVTCQGIRLDLPEDPPGGAREFYAAAVFAKLAFSQRF